MHRRITAVGLSFILLVSSIAIPASPVRADEEALAQASAVPAVEEEAPRRRRPDAAVRIALTIAYGMGGYVAGVALGAILTFLFAGYDLGGGISSAITIGAGSVLYVGLGGSALVLGVQQGARQGGGRPQPEFLVLGALLGALPGAGLTIGGGLAQSGEAASIGGALLFVGPLIGAVIAAEASNQTGSDTRDGDVRAEPVFRVSADGMFVGARASF